MPPFFAAFANRPRAPSQDGERQKEMQRSESSLIGGGAAGQPRNPHLQALSLLLAERFRAATLDPFGLYM